MSTTLNTYLTVDEIAAPSAPGAGRGLIYMDSGTSSWRTRVGAAGASDTIALADAAQTLANKTLTTPTIASFTNAGHTHQNAAGGAQLDHGLALTGLTDDDHTQYILVAGTRAFTGAQSMGGFKITSLGTPTAGTDAATKAYVDGVAAGVYWKSPARAATTAALPACTYANGASGVGATLTADANGAIPAQDGVTLVAADRLLVKNQAAGLQNGIYEVTQVGTAGTPFILTRVADMDEAADFPSGAAFVSEGTANGDGGYVCTNDAPVVVGTDAITFVQFTGLGQITAGDGLTKTGNTLDVGAGFGISVAPDSVAVDRTAAFSGSNQWTADHQFDANVLFGTTVSLTSTVADRLDLATGDSLRIVSGTFQIGAVTIFEADTDIAATLLPNADNTLDLGSASRRFANIYGANVIAGDFHLARPTENGPAHWRFVEHVDRIEVINEITGKRYTLGLVG